MKTFINGIIVSAVALLIPQITQAQGTTYLSNLGQTSAGSLAVGSDSWLAANFVTGNNANGYVLNSVQLAMTDATGNPSGFTVMLYDISDNPHDVLPGSSLGTLNGSLNPAIGGIYTYSPASNFVLSPGTGYFIVLTAGTAVADGAYNWNYAHSQSYNTSDGWAAPLAQSAVNNYQSTDGSHWNLSGGNDQFAINATPIPEPSPSLLLLLGSGVFIYVRRTFRR